MKKILTGIILGTIGLGIIYGCKKEIDLKWNRYIEDQLPCEMKLDVEDRSYQQIAKKVIYGTDFQYEDPRVMGQKLENYAGNPAGNHLWTKKKIKIPCGFSYQ